MTTKLTRRWRVALRRWGSFLRRLGFTLIALTAVMASAIVVWHAMTARTPESFDRWVGWANVHALWVGAVGVVLVVFDKALVPHLTGSERAVLEAIRTQVRTAERNRTAVVETTTPRGDEPVVEIGDVEAGQMFVRSIRTSSYPLTLVTSPGRGIINAAGVAAVLAGPSGSSEPVPVPFFLRRWEPGRQTVLQACTQELITRFSSSLEQAGDPVKIAQTLIDRGDVLPVVESTGEIDANRIEKLTEFGAEGHAVLAMAYDTDVSTNLPGGARRGPGLPVSRWRDTTTPADSGHVNELSHRGLLRELVARLKELLAGTAVAGSVVAVILVLFVRAAPQQPPTEHNPAHTLALFYEMFRGVWPW